MDDDETPASPLFVPEDSPEQHVGGMDDSLAGLTLEGPKVNGANSTLPDPRSSKGPSEEINPPEPGPSELQSEPKLPSSRHGSPPLKRTRIADENREAADANNQRVSEQACTAETTAPPTEQYASRFASALEQLALEQMHIDLDAPQQQQRLSTQQPDRTEPEQPSRIRTLEPGAMEFTFDQQQQNHQHQPPADMPDHAQGGDPTQPDFQPQQTQNDMMDFVFDPTQQQQEEPQFNFDPDPDPNPEPYQEAQKQKPHRSPEPTEADSIDLYPELQASPSPERGSPPKSFSPFTTRLTRPRPNPPVSPTNPNAPPNSTAAATAHSSPAPPSPQPVPQTNPQTPLPSTPPITWQALRDSILGEQLTFPPGRNPNDLARQALDHVNNLALGLYNEELEACEREDRLVELWKRASQVREHFVERRRDGMVVLRERRVMLERLVLMRPEQILSVPGWEQLLRPYHLGGEVWRPRGSEVEEQQGNGDENDRMEV